MVNSAKLAPCETDLPHIRLAVAKYSPHATAINMQSGGDDSINIEQLEVFGRVGVTENERGYPQRLTLTISVWPAKDFDVLDDDITETVNYSAICASARDFTREHSTKLIETLAAQLASHLLRVFPIRKVCIELRKFVLPDAKHVSVVLTRSA